MTTSRVFQINISDGGVPKLPVQSVEVTADGLAGDRQRNLKYHGGPDRAVCLYSLDRLLALQDGWTPRLPRCNRGEPDPDRRGLGPDRARRH